MKEGGKSTSDNNCQVFLTYDRMLLPPQKFNNARVCIVHKQLSGLPWLAVSVSTSESSVSAAISAATNRLGYQTSKI